MALQRFRFSLLTLLVVVGVAILLGTRLYIEPRLYWRDLWLLLFWVGYGGLMIWLVISAPWSARFFAIGFVGGAALELFALDYFMDRDLVTLTPGTLTPEGWYPLSLPIERLIVERGWFAVPRTFLFAWCAGMGMSGVVFGGLVCIIWRCVRHHLPSRWPLLPRWFLRIRPPT